MLVITHYPRLLDYIVPDRVHVLAGGRIVASGGKELALELEARGYAAIVAPESRRAPRRGLRLWPTARRAIEPEQQYGAETGTT